MSDKKFSIGVVSKKRHEIMDREIVDVNDAGCVRMFFMGNPEEYRKALDDNDGSLMGTKDGVAAMFRFNTDDQFAYFVPLSSIVQK